MSINEKLQFMSNKFKELKNTEIPIGKKMTIDELRKTAAQAEAIMQHNQCAENSRRRRQIQDIMAKCKQIEMTIIEKANGDIGNGGRFRKMQNSGYSQAELSKIAVRSVIMKQIRSSQLCIKPQQIQEIANKMQKNLDVMKEIEYMVKEQGNDLQRIDQYLQIAYENVQQANIQLGQAKQIQHRTRRLKFRMAISGFFGMLGYKLLGLPGALMGFLFGIKST